MIKTELLIKDILEGWRTQYKTVDLAQKYGCSEAYIYQLISDLRKSGAKIKRVRADNGLIEKIKKEMPEKF